MQNSFSLLILIAEIVIAVFELRSLLQSSSAPYYHPLVQLVARVTDPLVRIMPFRQSHVGGFFFAGVLLAFIIAFAFWGVLVFMWFGGVQSLGLIPLLAFLMTVKTFGYLLIILLLVQALTSWLPSTRSISALCYEITYPIVAPVQKIIPPIGVIDISLMVVLFILYGINWLGYRIFGGYWAIF